MSRYATKFMVTEKDRAHAEALTCEIKKAQEQLWGLIREAYLSGAYSSLGFATWNAYLSQTIDPARLRRAAVAALAMGDEYAVAQLSDEDTLVMAYVRDHPGCTIAELLTGIDRGHATQARVTKLRDHGLLRYEMEGRGRSGGHRARLYVQEEA